MAKREINFEELEQLFDGADEPELTEEEIMAFVREPKTVFEKTPKEQSIFLIKFVLQVSKSDELRDKVRKALPQTKEAADRG